MAERIRTTIFLDPGTAAGTLAPRGADRLPANALPASLRARLAPSLARQYQERVAALDQDMDAFAWPGPDLPLADARQASLDPGLDGKLAASLPGQGRPYERFLSRGFEPDAASSLAPGTYSFEMTLDGTTEELSVDLAAGDTQAQVLDKVARAVNEADLPVQARSLFQSAPGQRLAGSLATGRFLSLDLNQAAGAGELALRDTAGHLLASLDLAAATAPTDPAALAEHQVLGRRTATATAFVSATLDPGAAASLAAGTYSLDWTSGPASGSASFQVQSGDTWRDVLDGLASVLNSSQDRFQAQVSERGRKVYQDGRALDAEGVLLGLTSTSPKLGERLSLSGTDAASQAALRTLGLSATATPGTDGLMSVDGLDLLRQPGTFEADQGRLLLDLLEPFGQALPLRVTAALENLEQGLTSVAASYNSLRRLLLADAGQLQPGLAEDWRAPLLSGQAGLSWLGLRESGAEGLLWLDAEAFYSALGQAPDTARALIEGEGGLFGQWRALAADHLDGDPQRFLAGQAATPTIPEILNEVDLERGRRLLDLYETPGDGLATALDRAAGRLVDEKG